MEQTKQIERAKAVLQLNLDWIGRYDTRIAFIASIQIAMLGLLAKSGASISGWSWSAYLAFGISASALFVGLVFVYLSQYPKTDSQNSSLIFFGTIAPLKIDDFKKKFLHMNENEYLDDLLYQIHINSLILTKKFSDLKSSLRLLAIGVPLWLYAIYLSGIFMYK